MADPLNAGAAEPVAPSAMRLLLALIDRWPWVVVPPVVAGLLAVPVVLMLPPTYAASVTFVPEQTSGIGIPEGLSAIATQFGVRTGAAPGQSPDFYAQLLRSREMTDSILLSTYEVAPSRRGDQPGPQTLLDLWRVRGPSQRRRLDMATEALVGNTDVSVDRRTGIVGLTVKARRPDEAAAVANRYVALVNSFNMTTRASQARHRRAFLVQRVQEGGARLRTSEDSLRRFLERNRDYRNSPTLVFEHERLDRAVDFHRDLNLTLERALEQARIDEVNTSPVITVIDEAVIPSRRIAPRRRKIVMGAALVAALLGAVAALIADRPAALLGSDPAAEREIRERLSRISTRFGRHSGA